MMRKLLAGTVALAPVLYAAISSLFPPAIPLLRALGIAGVGLLAVLLIGEKLPVVRSRLADRYMGMGVQRLGDLLILIDYQDGVYELAPARYDADRDGYWAELPEGDEFYDADGISTHPGTFYGVRLVTAYDGLGSVEDLMEGEIEIKTPSREDEPWVKRKALDLRDSLHNAPFHIRPEAFHRVEKNAQKRQGTGPLSGFGPVGQAAIIMGAFALGGGLAWFVMTNGGGGGGQTLPFLLLPP